MRVAVPQLVLRLVLVGIVTVILQVSAVTQLQIFGTNADLMPLVIAAVGLLAGSIAGACFGFAVGLFLDLALVQTVGLSSLVYVGIGYWAGRFRELRDPQSALVPLAVGAAATAAAMIGYSLMQFLLGVERAGQLPAGREILATVLLNGVIATPVYAIVRRVLLPALPEDPRRRRRRAYTTGGLSPLSLAPQASRARIPSPSTSAGRRSRRSSRCAWRCWAASPSCSSRSSSSACGTCRCSPATSTCSRRATTACASCASRRRAATSSIATATCWSRTAPPPSSQLDPESLPAAERNAAATWGQRRDRALAPAQGPEGPAGPDPAARDAAPRDPLQEPRAAC